MLYKKVALQNFTKFTGKHQSLFNKAEACNFIEKRILTQGFSVNFVQFLRTPILKNTSERLQFLNLIQNVLNKFQDTFSTLFI